MAVKIALLDVLPVVLILVIENVLKSVPPHVRCPVEKTAQVDVLKDVTLAVKGTVSKVVLMVALRNVMAIVDFNAAQVAQPLPGNKKLYGANKTSR